MADGIKEKKLNYYFFTYSKILDLMRQNYIEETDEVIELAEKHSFLIDEEDCKRLDKILRGMNNDTRNFDFTDMIYRVIKDDVSVSKFDSVFVDESQDLSKIQQMIIKRIKTRRGRMIAVGDPNQAIYGFAGADVDSYMNLKHLHSKTIELHLSVNYRCGKRIVFEAQLINDQIEAY